MRRRLLAIFLTLTMALAVFPASALAVEETGLCPHHQTHTVDCGYTEPAEGTPCTHVHTAACYSDADLPADGEEKEADACTHVHDAECGYSEGSAGSPCTFVCNICPVEAMIEALPAYTDAAEEDVVDIEAAQAAYDALTEEEQAAVNPELADKLADLSDLALLLTNVQNTSDAEPLVDDGMSGNCGTDGNESSVTWKLEKNNVNEENVTYTLTISGEGQMADFGSNDVPWKKALSDADETYTDKTTNGETNKPKTFYPITKIVIEDDITSIGNNAFSYTDVSEITIPNSVTTIGSGVFTWTLQLEEIHIPASVTNLNYTEGDNGEYTYYNTFDGAFNLKNITVEKGSDNYAVVGDILIGKLQDTEDEWMMCNHHICSGGDCLRDEPFRTVKANHDTMNLCVAVTDAEPAVVPGLLKAQGCSRLNDGRYLRRSHRSRDLEISRRDSLMPRRRSITSVRVFSPSRLFFIRAAAPSSVIFRSLTR